MMEKAQVPGVKKEAKKIQDRGAKDDWEALKLMLDEHSALKQRVIFKIREIRRGFAAREAPTQISLAQQRDFRRNKQKGP